MAIGFVNRPNQNTTDGYNDIISYSEMPNATNREMRHFFRQQETEILEKRKTDGSLIKIGRNRYAYKMGL